VIELLHGDAVREQIVNTLEKFEKFELSAEEKNRSINTVRRERVALQAFAICLAFKLPIYG
jgi:DNA anti-recombination protein RmuC